MIAGRRRESLCCWLLRMETRGGSPRCCWCDAKGSSKVHLRLLRCCCCCCLCDRWCAVLFGVWFAGRFAVRKRDENHSKARFRNSLQVMRAGKKKTQNRKGTEMKAMWGEIVAAWSVVNSQSISLRIWERKRIFCRVRGRASIYCSRCWGVSLQRFCCWSNQPIFYLNHSCHWRPAGRSIVCLLCPDWSSSLLSNHSTLV